MMAVFHASVRVWSYDSAFSRARVQAWVPSARVSSPAKGSSSHIVGDLLQPGGRNGLSQTVSGTPSCPLPSEEEPTEVCVAAFATSEVLVVVVVVVVVVSAMVVLVCGTVVQE